MQIHFLILKPMHNNNILNIEKQLISIYNNYRRKIELIMISKLRNFLIYSFLPRPKILAIKFTKPQLNLAQKISPLFQPAISKPIAPSISELQCLQSASVGSKLGVFADFGLGPLPTLAIDTSCVVSGMYLRKKKPALAYGMIGYGLTDNLMQAAHPFTGVFSGQGLSSSDSLFNTSIGLPGHLASICTSSFFAAIVPVAGFFAYKHSKRLAANSISDLAAIKHWIQSAEKDPAQLAQLQKLWDSYSAKQGTNQLEKICAKIAQTTNPLNPLLESKEVLHFIQFLLDNAPQEAIQQAKEEILESQRKKTPDDPILTVLASTAVAGGVALIAAKILAILTEKSFFAVNVIITALTAISIVGLVASVLTSAYQTYQDLSAPERLMPQEAKMYSIAKLICNIATAALLTGSIFIPGVNLVLVTMLVLTSIVSIYANFKRSEIIQEKAALEQASRPETVQTMQALLKQHRLEKDSFPMSARLRKWVSLMSSDPATAPLAHSS